MMKISVRDKTIILLLTVVVSSISALQMVDEPNADQRYKRFAPPSFKQPNKSYQACVAPDNRKGHCKHLSHCMLSEFKTNIWRFLDYFCVIEKVNIGVCCPDEVIDSANPEFSGRLPATGEEIPVWGVSDLDGNVLDQADEQEADAIIARPEERGCGLATKQFPKITGGRPADPGEWPWMVALLSRQPRTSAYCGGVLVTDRHVLTAAHCTMNQKVNDLYVRLGEYDFTRYNETRSRDFRVVEIRQHVDFDATTYVNDIAILKLQRPSLFNSYIWPICLPPTDENWEGYTGIVTGWGSQSFGGPHSKTLMEVSIPVWSNTRCQDVFVHRIYSSTMCAGAPGGGRDSCQGDSGGPLMIQLPNKRWVVAGIVSWGLRCGEPNRPGIYTRVSSYIRWIIENSVF